MMQGDGASRQSFRKAIDAWNTEIRNYHGQKIGQGNLADYGHYTQVCGMKREKPVQR